MTAACSHLIASKALFPRPFLIIASAAFAVVLPFFFLGILAGHDFEFHMNSWMEVLSQWKQGIIYPRWAALAHHGYGEARFIFYPPFSWALGAALGAVLPWKLVPGAYVWLVLTASGCSMFVLARRWLEPRDAIFAATLYAANPYYLVIVYWRSAFAELLAGSLLPLLLLFVVRTEDEGSRPAISLSLIVAGAWLTNAPTAVMVNFSLVLLLLVIAVVHRSWRVLLVGATAVTLGASLAAFYILPAAYEQKWVNISQLLAPGARPDDNFLFTTINDAGHDAFNRLVSTIALAEIIVLAVIAMFARRWRHTLSEACWVIVAWAGAAALLMFSVTAVLWRYLPKMRFLQLPWRWLLCLNVLFALLVSVAWQHRFPRRVVWFAMVAVLAYGGWQIQHPWRDTAADIAELERRQHDGQGYEGTREYVPAGADAHGIKLDADPVTLEGDGKVQIHIEQWDAESRVFSAKVSEAGKLVLRLFNYPAWRVEVNDHVVRSETREATGQMLIPVQAGENRVHISFLRTWDRWVGAIVSGGMILALTCGLTFHKRHASRI